MKGKLQFVLNAKKNIPKIISAKSFQQNFPSTISIQNILPKTFQQKIVSKRFPPKTSHWFIRDLHILLYFVMVWLQMAARYAANKQIHWKKSEAAFRGILDRVDCSAGRLVHFVFVFVNIWQRNPVRWCADWISPMQSFCNT